MERIPTTNTPLPSTHAHTQANARPPPALSVYFTPPPPPQKKNTHQVERVVACDASSLSFLRGHGLDFNAWVDGVPFLAMEQEASLRKQIEDQVRKMN